MTVLQQQRKKIGCNQEHLPAFRALPGIDLEGNAGTIHAFNLEHFLFLKSFTWGQSRMECGYDPCVPR